MTKATDGEFTVIIDATDTTGMSGGYKFDIKKRVSAKFSTLLDVDDFIVEKVVYKEP